MTDAPHADRDPLATADEAPALPSAAWVPGVALLFVGLWMVTDGGPLPLGWAAFAVGLALLVIGAVAKGVAWGLELHEARDR